MTQAWPTVTLNNGVVMPQLGYGVFQIGNEETARCVRDAVAAGYRSIDTAMVYGNEPGTGEGIKTCGVPREELFITTKVWNTDHGYEKTLASFEQSLKNLGLSYLDLYLIHWPVPQQGLYAETWRALEKLYKDGRVRAIGVSNFNIGHLETLLGSATVVPAVNQVELHPFFNQAELRTYLKSKGIIPEAWGPLAQGNRTDDPALASIAKAYGKTVQQVMLRWHLQNGVIAIPKSTRPERMASNTEVFDFTLSTEDMARIDRLDTGVRFGPDPETFVG